MDVNEVLGSSSGRGGRTSRTSALYDSKDNDDEYDSDYDDEYDIDNDNEPAVGDA